MWFDGCTYSHVFFLPILPSTAGTMINQTSKCFSMPKKSNVSSLWPIAATFFFGGNEPLETL
jgi:hypothetical protein